MPYNFLEFDQEIAKTFAHVKKDLASIRTGKASVQMLDSVMVEAYGSHLRLVEVAQVSAPEPTLLVISPYDKSQMESVEKAIRSAGLNLQPVVSGDIIRIAVAPLTGERRQEMVKLLNQKIEDARVMVRSVRLKIKKMIESQKDSEGVSEDDIESDLEALDQKVKDALVDLDEMKDLKEKELTTL